jgi:hypothetical protein
MGWTLFCFIKLVWLCTMTIPMFIYLAINLSCILYLRMLSLLPIAASGTLVANQCTPDSAILGKPEKLQSQYDYTTGWPKNVVGLETQQMYFYPHTLSTKAKKESQRSNVSTLVWQACLCCQPSLDCPSCPSMCRSCEHCRRKHSPEATWHPPPRWTLHATTQPAEDTATLPYWPEHTI